MRRTLLLTTTLAGVVALAVIVSLYVWTASRELPVIAVVPHFSLFDQTGRASGSAELAGNVWIASFIYTKCEGPCPVIVQRLAELDRRLSTPDSLRLVSFTVDPQTDTPTVLAEYGRSHGVDASRWKLLTGPPDQLFDLVRNGFFLPVEIAAGGDTEAAERVTHSVRLVLVDGRMRIRGYYHSGDSQQLARLNRDTRRLLAQSTDR